MGPRVALVAGLATALAWIGGCSTAETPFPDTGGLLVVLRDSSLGTQRSPTAQRIYVGWNLQGVTAVVPEFPSGYSYLPVVPCELFASAGRDADPRRCGGSALTLQSDVARPLTIELDVIRMEARRAERPDLPLEGDWDGDGVTNSVDNCPTVSNPAQENVNAGQESIVAGDACSSIDPLTELPTIPDQDLDGVSDFVDNCQWVPNAPSEEGAAQADSDADGIGDACELRAPVFLPGGQLRLVCETEYTQSVSSLAVFVVDFDAALVCDASFTGCTLDPSAVTLAQSGNTAVTEVACRLAVP